MANWHIFIYFKFLCGLFSGLGFGNPLYEFFLSFFVLSACWQVMSVVSVLGTHVTSRKLFNWIHFALSHFRPQWCALGLCWYNPRLEWDYVGCPQNIGGRRGFVKVMQRSCLKHVHSIVVGSGVYWLPLYLETGNTYPFYWAVECWSAFSMFSAKLVWRLWRLHSRPVWRAPQWTCHPWQPICASCLRLIIWLRLQALQC